MKKSIVIINWKMETIAIRKLKIYFDISNYIFY